MITFASLQALAERIALSAADLLLDGLGQTRHDVESKTSTTDLVTDIDRASERLIVDAILRERPHDSIVGEEGANVVGTSSVSWLIDPLDGTTNYVYGHPGFSVSIGVQVDGAAVVGVVADPLHGDLFSAHRGGGAWRNGAQIRCSALTELDHALVATGFSYRSDARRRQAEILTTVLPSVRDVRRMGGAAVDLASVACGRVDAYYERGLQPWDLAAGAVIASEGGARVGDLDGGPPSGACCVAAPPGLFGPLVELLITAELATSQESGQASHNRASR